MAFQKLCTFRAPGFGMKVSLTSSGQKSAHKVWKVQRLHCATATAACEQGLESGKRGAHGVTQKVWLKFGQFDQFGIGRTNRICTTLNSWLPLQSLTPATRRRPARKVDPRGPARGSTTTTRARYAQGLPRSQYSCIFLRRGCCVTYDKIRKYYICTFDLYLAHLNLYSIGFGPRFYIFELTSVVLDVV